MLNICLFTCMLILVFEQLKLEKLVSYYLLGTTVVYDFFTLRNQTLIVLLLG